MTPVGPGLGGTSMKRRSALALAGLGATGATGAATAQQGWPARPLRMVIPFAPGGGSDRVGRMLAEPLGRALGQPVVVDNRPGGGGTTAAAFVAAQPADGYTLFYGTPGQLTINPILMRDLPYDPERDFQPVSLLLRAAYGIAVHPSVPARGLAELIALAKARPGAMGFATAGVGSGPHLAGELLRITAGIDITHVPYRGSALAIQDVVAGQVPISIDSMDIFLPQVRSGALRPLAVTSAERVSVLPEVPTVAETLPGYEVTVFNYVAVRSGTPRPIVERLSREIQAVLRLPQVVEPNAQFATVMTGSTPEELGRILREESAKWREVITRAGIRLE
jgi:tripartite-type tricarboxylate transporter receptor subunit TctC